MQSSSHGIIFAHFDLSHRIESELRRYDLYLLFYEWRENEWNRQNNSPKVKQALYNWHFQRIQIKHWSYIDIWHLANGSISENFNSVDRKYILKNLNTSLTLRPLWEQLLPIAGLLSNSGAIAKLDDGVTRAVLRQWKRKVFCQETGEWERKEDFRSKIADVYRLFLKGVVEVIVKERQQALDKIQILIL